MYGKEKERSRIGALASPALFHECPRSGDRMVAEVMLELLLTAGRRELRGVDDTAARQHRLPADVPPYGLIAITELFTESRKPGVAMLSKLTGPQKTVATETCLT